MLLKQDACSWEAALVNMSIRVFWGFNFFALVLSINYLNPSEQIFQYWKTKYTYIQKTHSLWKQAFIYYAVLILKNIYFVMKL